MQTPRDPSVLRNDADEKSAQRNFARDFQQRAPWIFAATAAASLGFIAVASLMVAGETNAFDRWLLVALRQGGDLAEPIGPEWLKGYMRDITALGGFGVLSFLVLTVSGFLYAINKRREAAIIFGISLSGWFISQTSKLIFSRPRPDVVPHNAEVFSASFPSGHAMVSAVVYLTLASVLSRTTDDPRIKLYVLSLAFLMTAAIGFSRVYLGVHWPSDVLGGWALGAAWVGLCWLWAGHRQNS
jgi:undecaprenyl-diphosphatase